MVNKVHWKIQFWELLTNYRIEKDLAFDSPCASDFSNLNVTLIIQLPQLLAIHQ